MTDAPTQDKLQDMLRKVQAMLARADHPNTPPAEAETSRRMAGELMEKYRIDEQMLQDAAPPGQGILPVWSSWTICSNESLYHRTYRDLCSLALNHFECRAVYSLVDSDSGYSWQCTAVGYESDLRMVEVLYTATMLAFQAQVEPGYHPDLPDQVNAYAMRKAGMEGWRIAMAIYGQNTKSLRSKVRRMFVVEAERRGEDPKALLGNTDVKTFRKDYAEAFEMETWHRLSRMRAMRGEFSAGLVLRSRVERVNEAFYERYPQYRPVSHDNSPQLSPNHGCAKCAAAKGGFCREHAYLKPKKEAQQKFVKHNSAAAQRGREAARQVDLGATPDGRRLDG